ncbi:DUF1679 domain-containing protein [Henriciella barbarensis]|uniref:DUF1679 domain-containing protein n=1 Tax=Henriciella barbarensis TaxID=86342 RepID=A0A399QY87_9PROT|nr:phosphotransferase [Henriciella barbarensis]RIJ23481.1 DUF1679 domain-containing protein [Henriciella barbarensis]
MVNPGAQDFDTGLHAFIAEHLPGTQLERVTRLTGGVSADVYKLDLNVDVGLPAAAVLRIHGATHSGHDAAVEFQLLQSAQAAGLPVAAPIAHDPAGTTLGRPCLLIAYVDGSTSIPHAEMPGRLDQMADLISSVHATPIDGFPLLQERIDPLPDLFSLLQDPALESEWRQRLSHLGSTRFTGTPVLLHGDLWPENLIWSQGRIAALLDWEDAAIGDPLSDVACTCLELRYVFGREGLEAFKAAYARRNRVDEARLTLWLAYVAAGALRFMGDWNLPAAREARMRAEATATLDEAAASLTA